MPQNRIFANFLNFAKFANHSEFTLLSKTRLSHTSNMSNLFVLEDSDGNEDWEHGNQIHFVLSISRFK